MGQYHQSSKNFKKNKSFFKSQNPLSTNLSGMTNLSGIPNPFEMDIESQTPVIQKKKKTDASSDPRETHTVESGESLSWIAKKHQVDIEQLVEWNGIKDIHKIRIGQVLYVSEPLNKNNEEVCEENTKSPIEDNCEEVCIENTNHHQDIAKKETEKKRDTKKETEEEKESESGFFSNALENVSDYVKETWNSIEAWSSTPTDDKEKVAVSSEKETEGTKTTEKEEENETPAPVVATTSNDKKLNLTLGLQKTVGIGMVNDKDDVELVRKRLVELDFLDSSKTDQASIHAAIKKFQKDALGFGTQDGQISVGGITDRGLSTWIVVAPTNYKVYKTALKDFKVTTSGETTSEFTSWKDGTNVGKEKDPTKVDISAMISLQDRLMLLKKSLLGKNFSNGKLKAIQKKEVKEYTEEDKKVIKWHIDTTTTAIERFQTEKEYRFRASYFANKKQNNDASKYILTDSSTKLSYTKGEITKGDASYTVLEQIKYYNFSYKGLDGTDRKIKSRNFVRSGVTTYEEGMGILGSIKPKNYDADKFKTAGGLTDTQAKALKFASSHEGKFDAINTYDQAVFSYGFIQFAGGGFGTFAKFMAYLKIEKPETFKERFQKYGIDVEFTTTKNDKIKNTKKNVSKGKRDEEARIVVFDPENKKKLSGREAEIFLKDNPVYYGVFMRAAEDDHVKDAQIGMAVNDYLRPVENHKLNVDFEVLKIDNGKDAKGDAKKPTIKVGKEVTAYKKTDEYKTAKEEGKITESKFKETLKDLRMKDVIRSEKGLAGLYSLMVNNPVDARKVFRQAIKQTIKEEGLTTLAEVKAISADKLLEKAYKNLTSEIRKSRLYDVKEHNKKKDIKEKDKLSTAK